MTGPSPERERTYRLGHHLLGIEGLALLRSTGAEDEAARGRRVAEVMEIATRLDEAPYAEPRGAPSIGRDAGYAVWAESYDDPGNVTILGSPARVTSGAWCAA